MPRLARKGNLAGVTGVSVIVGATLILMTRSQVVTAAQEQKALPDTLVSVLADSRLVADMVRESDACDVAKAERGSSIRDGASGPGRYRLGTMYYGVPGAGKLTLWPFEARSVAEWHCHATYRNESGFLVRGGEPSQDDQVTALTRRVGQIVLSECILYVLWRVRRPDSKFTLEQQPKPMPRCVARGPRGTIS